MATPIDVLVQQQALTNLPDGAVALSRLATPEELKASNLAAPGVPRVGDGAVPRVVGETMQSRACSNCDGAVNILMKFCPNCGLPLQSVCKKCGAENQTGKFCSNCGKAMSGKKSKRASTD